MKRLALLMLVLLATASVAADRRQFCLDVLHRFAPDGYAIVEKYESTPWQFQVGGNGITLSHADFMDFVTESDPVGMVSRLGTAVHEECHNYSRKMGWYYMVQQHLPYADSFAYPIQHGDGVLVRLTPTFPSSEMAHRIPAPLQQGRFQVYVGTKNQDESTEQRGVYGLMDEFVAYEHGFKTSLDTRGWYVEQKASLQTWMTDCQSPASARGEFVLFILAWLREAQEKHPEIFKQVLDNADLWRVFALENDAFVADLAQFQREGGTVEEPQRAEIQRYRDLLERVTSRR